MEKSQEKGVLVKDTYYERSSGFTIILVQINSTHINIEINIIKIYKYYKIKVIFSYQEKC